MAEQGQRQMSEQAQSYRGEPIVSAPSQRAAWPCPAPGSTAETRQQGCPSSTCDPPLTPLLLLFSWTTRTENHKYFDVERAVSLMASGCRAWTFCHQKWLLLRQKYFENVNLNSTLGNTNQLTGQGQQPSPCRHSSNLSNNFKIRKETLKALQTAPYERQHFIFTLIIAVMRYRGK